MAPQDTLHLLLGIAVLLPLFSFVFILVLGPRLGKGGGYVATGAILAAALLSFFALIFIWLPSHWPEAASHDTGHHLAAGHDVDHQQQDGGKEDHAKEDNSEQVKAYTGDY